MTLAPLVPLLAEAERRRDPMVSHRACGPHAEWIYRHLGDTQIYAHGGNKVGKTRIAAAIAVGLCRGLPSLAAFDGQPIPIPQPWDDVPPHVRGVIGTPTYKLGRGSIVQSIRELLGDWPHHEEFVAGGTSVIHIRHERDRDDDWRKWSELYVCPYDGPLPEGFRLDFWLADEPPPLAWLDAIRNRGKRGKRLYGGIFGTPIDVRDWEPIRDQFPTVPRHIVRGRASIGCSVYDNRFLHLPTCPGYSEAAGYCSCSCPDIVAAEEANAGSPYAKARLFGEHVNAAGGCPYDDATLDRWESQCREPIDVIRFIIQGERDTGWARETAALLCQLEVWACDEDDDEYIVIVDPARGLDDGRHDPDGLHVRSRRTKALVARANEYLGAWGLGAAAVEVGRAYRNARIYVARGGGYGESALSACRVLGYHWLGADRDAARIAAGRQLGVVETGDTRIKAMQAVAAMLQRGDCDVPSRDVIRALRNCIIDRNGKIVARAGYHDEDLVLLGHGNRLLDQLGPLPERRSAQTTSQRAFARAMRMDFGRSFERARGNGGVPVDPGRW